MTNNMTFTSIPKFLAIGVPVQRSVLPYQHIHITFNTNTERSFRLRGVIYFGNFHFTSRYFDNNKLSWYHDGMQNGGTCIDEGNMANLLQSDLLTRKGSKAVFLFYSCV